MNGDNMERHRLWNLGREKLAAMHSSLKLLRGDRIARMLLTLSKAKILVPWGDGVDRGNEDWPSDPDQAARLHDFTFDRIKERACHCVLPGASGQP
jgi:hypothetical protein